MQKFMCILNNSDGMPDYRYPSELCGTSKSEIYNLLLENTPEENIAAIYTEEEYYNFMNSSKGKVMTAAFSDNSEEDGNTFFNKMLDAAKTVASSNNNLIEETPLETLARVSPVVPITEMPQPVTQVAYTNSTPVKYFTDNGIQFKLENNQLFKKVWKRVLTESTEDVAPEFRIVNSLTGKLVNNSKYAIEQLQWEAIN
jgi:hypothetical protein